MPAGERQDQADPPPALSGEAFLSKQGTFKGVSSRIVNQLHF